MKYIFLDDETGGIGLDKSLLTVYLMVTDDKWKFLGDLYLFLKPEDGVYRVTGESMSIHGINLSEHDKIAMPYKEGGKTLYNFLKKHSDEGRDKLTPVGHGVKGDIDHIIDKLVSRGTWDTFCSYRVLDTSSTVQFLKTVGVFPDITGSLESLAKHFGIIESDWHNEMDEPNCIVTNDLHDAKVDTMVTFKVLQKLIEMVKPLKDNEIHDPDCRCESCLGTIDFAKIKR